MRNNSVNLHVRLNLNQPDQKKVWEYIQTMPPEKSLRLNQVVTEALLDRMEKEKGCEFSILPEDCELVQESVHKVISILEKELDKAVPMYFAGMLSAVTGVTGQQTNLQMQTNKGSGQDEAEADGLSGRPIPPEEIDWSFLGE